MKNKTAVITGASSGIGMELARLFAADGYDLIVTARRVELLQKLSDELMKAYGTSVRIIQMDIAQPYAGEALWKAISDITPDIEVLVNNAGVGDSSDFATESPEVIERMIHLNISTLTALTRHALPQMVKRDSGKILNVASLAGYQPGGPGMAVYYATKSYVLSFSRSLRSELSGSGVSVTVLCPGATATEFEQTASAQNTLLFKWSKPMDAKTVALAGYRGMQRGCGEVVPGLLNKFLAVSPKLGPAAIALAVNKALLARRS
ncbi:MAG: SDR family oxidoreductase [Gallionella sp.]|nr:SDR family oxidoreductase [Gallionella sp.]